MEELKTLGSKSNLAEELYRRIGPFDFDKNQPRNSENKAGGQGNALNKNGKDDVGVADDEQLEFRTITLKKGQKYYGQCSVRTGKRHGRGTIMWDDKSTFEGFWRNDKANG